MLTNVFTVRPQHRGTARFMMMLLCFFVLRMAVPRAAAAQQHSNVASANLTMTVGESITIIPPTQTVTLNYTQGQTTTPPSTFQITTLWQLANTHTTMHVNWWFGSATAALTAGGSANIPSSQVFSNVDGSAYSDCAHPGDTLVPAAVSGATCNVGLVIPLSAANYAAQQTDTIGIELQNLSTALPSGTYNGVLNIQAGTN
jgi:hypothetical protein